MKDRQHEKLTELTPDQMEKVSGGKTPSAECSHSPNGRHNYVSFADGIIRCEYCLEIRKKSYEIF